MNKICQLLLSMAVFFVLVSCLDNSSQTSNEPVASDKVESKRDVSSGKTILMVIAPENFRDEELFEPKKIFEQNGASVVIASTSKEQAKGMLGGTVTPQYLINEIDVNNFDAIVIVGGIGSKTYLWDNKDLLDLVKAAHKNKKVIGAICLAPVVLAQSRCFTGVELTVYPDLEAANKLINNHVKYVKKNVAVSGNVITGNGPNSATEFARKIWDVLIAR